MDNVNITTNQPLLLVPKRIGVNKFLRAGSKRQTKVRAFQITYDKAHRGTPNRDNVIKDKCQVENKRTSSRSSRAANKLHRLTASTDQPSCGTSAKRTDSRSLSKKGNSCGSSQYRPTEDDYSEEQGKASPLRQSTKGLSNQSSHFSSSSSRGQHETRNEAEISGSGDDEGITVSQHISDCENISPSSQTRATPKRRSPRRSINEIADSLQKRQSVKGTPPKKKGDEYSERDELDSEGLNDGVSEKAKELSEMLAVVQQGKSLLSSPLLRSARSRSHHSRTKTSSFLQNSDKKKISERNKEPVLCVDGNEAPAHSESIQTGYKMDEGSVSGGITRSSRLNSTKENSHLVVQRDKSAAEIINSDNEEDVDEAGRLRLKRLEKQLGGMTPLGLRETVEGSNTGKTNSRQHENKAETVSSVQVDNELTSNHNIVKSVKSKKPVCVSKTNKTKNKTVTRNLEQDLGTPSTSKNNVSSQSKKKAKNKKEIQNAENQISSKQKLEDEGLNVSRRRRSPASGERSDSESQSRSIEPGVSPEEAKKLEKLQKQLGGMSPMDRTLALLSESRAKLSTTMPSLLDMNASQSKEANSKASTKPLMTTKQQTKGENKSTSNNKPESVNRRKGSSSNQESSKSTKVKIKLNINKKTKMTGGKAKVLIDSDPEEDVQALQTSESEMEEADAMEELNVSRKRRISDLSDLDVVIKHLKEEGELSRNNLKKKRQRTVHDDVMSSVTSDMLELIKLNTKMKGVTSLERKAQTKLTKKRKELLEMQQEHRKLCGHISDLKRQKQTNAADPTTKDEVAQFLKSLEHLYKEAGRTSSDGE